MPTDNNDQQSISPEAGNGNDNAGLNAVVNAALAGVPLAYVTSGSVTVTALAAGSAVVLTLVARRRR